MSDYVNDDVINRIQKLYTSASPAEKSLLKQILEEIAIYGDSQTYRDIWLADFKEVPVTMEEFICNPVYLGEVTNGGKQVYPFWQTTLSDIFEHGNQYNEIILSGATRIGKTSTAVTIMAYMLYRLMLYRNPHEYFQKKAISRFTIAFANLTKDLAEGVAFHEFNTTLRESKWFMDHGEMNRSIQNPIYLPEGNKIDIIAGSDAAHLLGLQIWCLKGDTQILTTEGVKRIEDCVNTSQNILQLVDDALVPSTADVMCTGYTDELIRIELKDGTIIEGTPEHRVMLSDGTYKALGDLSSSDDLRTLTSLGLKGLIYHQHTDRQMIKSYGCALKIKSIQKIKYDEPIPVYDVVDVQPNHNFAIIQNDTIVVSHNCCTMDETNFAKAGVKDINIAKAHMKNLYDTVNARISGTFRIRGEVYGKLIASSSKNTDSDFLSDHIESQLNAGNTHLYLVDKPQWEVLPPSMFSDKKFHFTVGDRFKKGFVIPEENDDEAHHKEYLRQGYKVVEAPAEFRKNFIADYDISLRDIAGVSVVGAMGFITQEAITPNISSTRHNPFFTDIIQLGTQDNKSIEEFFRMEVVPARLKHCLMNIHLDLSETGDRTGMCGVCVDGEKTVTDFDGRKVSLPFFREVFSVGISPPRGDRLSFQKVVNFLFWLRRNGFNIGTISTDQYQSSYMRELLNGEGFKTSKISVDRSEEPYIGLKNILYDQRIELVKNDARDEELINLQRVNNKIDHKPTSSKDISDCLAGACYTLTTEHAVSPPPPSSVSGAIAAVNGNKRGDVNSLPMFNTPYKRY